MNSGGWEFKKNSMMGTYELRLELSARIAPAINHYDLQDGPGPSLYATPQKITVTVPESFFQQPDPDKLISMIQRQVQGIWTQAVAGMAGRYTDLILEAIAPSIQEILELQEAKRGNDHA